MSTLCEVIDRDSLRIVWGYLTWEDQLVIRQCDERLLHEHIQISETKTCRGNDINITQKHWVQNELSKQVEDVHNYCTHKDIREAARIYSQRTCIDYNTVKLRTGKYKGRKLNRITNFSYLESLLRHQRNHKLYTEIHEYLCSRFETQPECISFGTYKGQRYDQLPTVYRNWLLSINLSHVDSAALISSFKRARYYL